jgi:AcrR family transcriptional regulator
MAYRKTEHVQAQLAKKRAQILHAARQLIAEGGFHEAPVQAVALMAGVAVGTVYKHFPSKSALFAEVVSETSQRELEVVAAIVMADGTARERLSAAIRAFSDRALRARRLAYALVAEPVDAEIDVTRLKYRRALSRVFETLIEQGVRAKEFPPQDVGPSAACLVGACIEGLVGPLSPETITAEEDGQRLIEALIAFCLRAVACGGSNVVSLRPTRKGLDSTRGPPQKRGRGAGVTP